MTVGFVVWPETPDFGFTENLLVDRVHGVGRQARWVLMVLRLLAQAVELMCCHQPREDHRGEAVHVQVGGACTLQGELSCSQCTDWRDPPSRSWSGWGGISRGD